MPYDIDSIEAVELGISTDEKGDSLIPVKLYTGLFLAVGGACFLLAAAAGQPRGMLLGLFFLGWGSVVWYLRYGKERAISKQLGQEISAPILLGGHGEFDPSRAHPNAALHLLRGDRTFEYTARMVKAIPGLARQLEARAREEAAKVNGAADWYLDCVLDLELTGAFQRALAFCKDAALASLFVDALLFEATGHQPTVPEDLDVMASLTHLYRGVGKYVIAKSTFSLPPSELPLWVFGAEYAAAIGCPLNTVRIKEIRPEALHIREFAFLKTSSALAGNIVVADAAYVKPTSFPGAEYLIRPGMQQPSKFKDQPEEYKDLILNSLKTVAQATPLSTDTRPNLSDSDPSLV